MIKLLSLGFGVLIATMSKAIANPACVVCTVAIGASLSIARKMGLEDNIIALWAGALLALLGFWLVKWFDKKGWNFYGRDFILIASSVAMIGFMYISDLVYTPVVMLYILYLDAFLFYAIIGALIIVYTSDLYLWMKENNGGRAHFPFEKVVIPVVTLLLVSCYIQYFPM